VKIDTETGGSNRWHEEGCYPGEPIFVNTSGTQREDEGLILSVVLDSRSGKSVLLLLDASDLQEMARVPLPYHVPIGFHGNFYRSRRR
jgi:beta,beta-carotene 9',10'-dioxygenase